MSVIAAVNFEDRLVLLEDGRELPITQFYGSGDPLAPLNANSQLLNHHRVDSWEQAEVFVVEFPGTNGVHLIVDMKSLALLKPSQLN